jgi:hypothetical protein
MRRTSGKTMTMATMRRRDHRCSLSGYEIHLCKEWKHNLESIRASKRRRCGWTAIANSSTEEQVPAARDKCVADCTLADNNKAGSGWQKGKPTILQRGEGGVAGIEG